MPIESPDAPESPYEAYLQTRSAILVAQERATVKLGIPQWGTLTPNGADTIVLQKTATKGNDGYTLALPAQEARDILAGLQKMLG